MIVHHVTQGSAEWLALRCGRPTASCFEKIVTATGKPSKQAEAYLYDLLAELMLGRPLEAPKFSWMERGSDLEADAVAWYGFQRDVEPEVIGFCTTDDGRIGASPDRLVGSDGLLETKCPSPGVHLSYFLRPERGVDGEYRPQVQGQLYVTGRKWCDIVSYHPELPGVIVRVERDEEYIALLAAGLKTFCDRLAEERGKLQARGLIREPAALAENSDDFISDADVDAIALAEIFCGLSEISRAVCRQAVPLKRGGDC